MPTTTDATTRSADGTTIAYDVTGTGTGVVVVDGELCHRLPSMVALAGFAQGLRVVRYDRRGRGASSDTPPYAVEREVEDVLAVLESAAPEGAVLLGLSSGSFLALRAAADLGPVRVRAVVVYAPPHDVSDVAPPDLRHVTAVEGCVAAGDPGAAVEVFLDLLGMPRRYVAGMRRSPSWETLETIAPTIGYDGRVMAAITAGPRPLAARWAEITQPVLVADGGASPALMGAAAASLAGVLPRARRVTLADQGHDADPAVLAPVLAQFVAGLTTA
ncbi:alpha/beta fold hydrolase [Antribacter gilvus]|uniref:alpha/beta fold hydrolase n=1 Tax=Antribacter gilvus TaxID=2304675 RepID=UPI000F7919FF|nr:alpha/beta hydrolase [Antribacter gilvus]